MEVDPKRPETGARGEAESTGGDRGQVSRAEAPQEVRLAEFSALRDEIQRRATIQQGLLGLNATVVAGVLGLAISSHEWAALLVIPIVSSTFGLLWVDNATMIAKLGTYILKLWVWEPSWEAHLRAIDRPSDRSRGLVEFWVPIAGAFAGPPIAALIAAAFKVSDAALLLPLAGFGLGLTGLCLFSLWKSRMRYEQQRHPQGKR
jgi:hypothetical protein